MLSETGQPFRMTMAACLLVAALLSLAIGTIRVHSVVRDGEWAQTTGYEAGGLNLIYREANGIRPYGDLDKDATPGVFNGLFYTIYGGVARPLVDRPVAMVLALRLFSFVVMTIAAIAFGREAARVLDRGIGNRSRSALMGAVCAIAVCFGPFTGWWWLTARPDIVVFACETIALVTVRRALDEGRRGIPWAAPICVALAWGFKQNAVVVAAALLVFAPEPAWRFRVALAAACAAVFAALRIYEGPFYTQQLIWLAAARGQLGLKYVMPQVVTALQVGAPFLLVPILELPAAWKRSASGRLTAFLFVLSGVAATIQLARVGPSRNYFFTTYLAGALLLVDAFAARTIAPMWRRAAMTAAAVYVAVLPALYLARPNQLGRVTVTTLDVADARARVVVMRAAAAPRYVEDNLDALPWHSGQAVIETIDQAVYDSSVSAGVITISIADRARAFYYGSAFVNSAVWRETFERAGYVLVRTLPGDVAYYRRPTT